MADKKSFILHVDSLDVIDDLTDEQAGQLFRAIKNYHAGGDFEPSPIIRIAFSAFKSQFKRDLEKYEKIIERNKNNGLKGGRPKTQQNPQKPTGLSGLSKEPKKADSGNGNGSVSGNGSGKESDKPRSKHLSRKHDHTPEIINYLNAKTGKNFKPVESHAKHIRARLAEGHTLDDIRGVIDRKTDQWRGTDSAEYLRPATLFNAEKFNQYVGEIGQPMPTGFGKGVETKEQSVNRINDQAARVAANMARRTNGH